MEAKQEIKHNVPNKMVNKKLTYEELQQKFGELFAQYQKATEYIHKLEGALGENTFNQTSFLVSMLFKVMDHPDLYNAEFVKWAVQNIESILTELANALSAPEKEPENGNNQESKPEEK